MYFLSKIIAKEESFNIFHHPNLEKMSTNAIIYCNLSGRPQKKSSIFYQNILKSVFLRNLIFLAKASLSTIFDQKVLEIIFKNLRIFRQEFHVNRFCLAYPPLKNIKIHNFWLGGHSHFFFLKFAILGLEVHYC